MCHFLIAISFPPGDRFLWEKGGRGPAEKRRIKKKDIDHSVRKARVGFEKALVHCQNLSVQLVVKVEPGCLSPRVILIQTGEQTLKAARMCVNLSNPKPFPCFHLLTHSIVKALVASTIRIQAKEASCKGNPHHNIPPR